jgi:large-conductance mechanosensitive channel
MPSFSPTDAAFAGFRFTKERPGAVAAWSGVFLIFNLLSAFVALLVGGQALRNFQSTAGNIGDMKSILDVFLPAAPAVAAIALLTLGCMALVYASALRLFLGLDDHLSFRAGHDERRVAVTIIAFSAIYFVVTIGVVIALGVVSNISDAFSSWLGGFFAWVTPLTPVIAVDRKRISLKESWVSTRGHFWPLAGALLLSIILFIVAAFLAFMVVAAVNHVASISTGGAVPRDLLARQEADDSNLLTLVIGQVVASISMGALLPIVLGPLVRAYQAYDAPDAPPQPVTPIQA